jgi:chromosome partitioning protein
MPVITLLNQKGGVGKTSTCHHLAGTLAAGGRRVLLIDNDPQASLSQGFWGPVATAQMDPAETVAAVYAGEAVADRIVKPSGIDGVDLVPGSVRSTRHNVPIPYEAEWDAQTCLRSFLVDVRDRYDVVLIDCPPNLHLCSWAALVASDHLIVPLQPEDYGSQGLGPVQESVELVAGGLNPGLNVLGFLLTMCNPRLAIHKLYEDTLREQYGRVVFETRVPYAADLKEAIAQRKPIALYKPKGASAKVIKALADEMLARMADTPYIGAAQEAA